MTTPLSQEQRAELVAKAKAELADNMHALAWKFLDYRLAPHDDFYHFAAVDSWRTAERYRIVVDALSALTVERDAALERVKALEAGGVVSLADARRAVDACGGTHPPGQEEYGKGYDAALTEADAALVRLGRECVR